MVDFHLIRIDERIDTPIKRDATTVDAGYGGRDVLRVANFQSDWFETESARGLLGPFHLQRRSGIAGIAEDRDPAQVRNHLMQEFDPFADEFVGLKRQA